MNILNTMLLASILLSCALQKAKTTSPLPAGKAEFKILTLDNMNEYEGSVLQYVRDAPQLKKELTQALQKNRELCKEGQDFNCAGMDQLKSDRENFHEGLIDITLVKACSTMDAIKEKKSLTGKADSGLLKELKVYRDAYKVESGHDLDMNKCE